MAIPKQISFVTFDVYGTLIDWETGVYDAFKAEAERDGFTIERDELIPLFHEIQKQIQAGSYELYAEVLRRTAVQIAKKLGWPLEPSAPGFLPDSVQRWPPFKETNPVLAEDRQEAQDRADLEHRRQAAGADPPPHPARLRPRRHRPAGPLVQARPRPLHRVRAADRRQEGLGPRRRELLLRRRAVPEEEDPRDLGQPLQGAARARPEEARRRGPNLREAAKLLGVTLVAALVARPRARSRPDRLHQPGLADHLHSPSARGEEAFVIDSPVYPGRARGAAGGARAGIVPGRRAAGDPRRLGPPARAPGVPATRRSAPPRARRRGCATSPARRQRELRALRRGALRRAPRGRSSSAAIQPLPVPGRLAARRRARARASPGRRAHRRRNGDLDARGSASSSAATTSRRSRSR